MFGIAIARTDQVSEAEKGRYQSLYCGLCLTLKERYGQIPRACLSYDLAFLATLMASLEEGPEAQGHARCPSHPARGVSFAIPRSMDYAADLSVALAYHKCLDDIEDDGSIAARGARALLESSYCKARERIPLECAAIEESMSTIRAIEADPCSAPDDAADEFGRLMGILFSHDAGIWEERMRDFGTVTGRFVYLMDAAIDLPDDEERGSYNPLASSCLSVPEMRTMLEALAMDISDAYQALPFEQDANLLQSVIYSGIWQKFNAVYSDA